MRQSILFMFIALLVMSGCATRQDLELLKGQVDMLQSRMSQEEKKSAEKDKLLEKTMKQQGELQNRYSELQNQQFTMQGSVDQVLASAGLTPSGGGRPGSPRSRRMSRHSRTSFRTRNSSRTKELLPPRSRSMTAGLKNSRQVFITMRFRTSRVFSPRILTLARPELPTSTWASPSMPWPSMMMQY